MKKLLSLFLIFVMLLSVGCGKQETADSSYDPLVQTFIDVAFGHDAPTKETVRSLRHEAMWSSDFDGEYADYLEDWEYNVSVLKEVFGEDYTYSVKILSSTGDTKSMEQVQDFLSGTRGAPSGSVTAYCNLELEITFSGNGKTYTAQGKLEVFAFYSEWYTTDSLLESVDNCRQ